MRFFKGSFDFQIMRTFYLLELLFQQRDIRSLTSTLKHELLHALGFSSSLFAYFRYIFIHFVIVIYYRNNECNWIKEAVEISNFEITKIKIQWKPKFIKNTSEKFHLIDCPFPRDKDGKPLTERGDDGKPPINFELQVEI